METTIYAKFHQNPSSDYGGLTPNRH